MKSKEGMEENRLKIKASQIKLLLLDADGVLTDGSIIYDEQGREVKVFNVRDGAMVKWLKRAGIEGENVDEVFVGHCRQAGNGPNPAKISSVMAGIPQDVHAVTINNACPSGMKAAIIGAQNILLGEITTAMIAGMESMSTIPYYMPKARWGARMFNTELVDGMVHDGLWEILSLIHI